MKPKDVYNLANSYKIILESINQEKHFDELKVPFVFRENKYYAFGDVSMNLDEAEVKLYAVLDLDGDELDRPLPEMVRDAQYALQDHVRELLKNLNEENNKSAESPFRYDPSHGLMQAANQINDILKSSYNDEATPEHIEKMALRILGPQAEYSSVDEFYKALEGVKALLNRYIVVQMN